MSETKIDKLTPEQEALIPVYQEKWRRIAFSTEQINYNQAAEVVKSVYELMGKQEPEIIFCSNPYQGLEFSITLPSEQRISEHIWQHLWKRLYKQLKVSVVEPPWKEVRKILGNSSLWMHEELRNRVKNSIKLELQLANYIETQHWAYSCILFEISIFLFNYLHDQKHWEVFQLLVKHCGCVILPYEKTCIVCDRPRILSFDNQHRLHAEGTPAIQFADGYSLYSYHGVTLPEKYGKLHPHQWQSQWLLEEENAELRRVLIQGIGYSRICQELEAIELDTWREYSLLRIDKNIDLEPITMLKMTCPSTGNIHILRVPPEITSAREAIKWVNWGVDAEDFSVQT